MAFLLSVYEEQCRNMAIQPNSTLCHYFAASGPTEPLHMLSLQANLIGGRGMKALLPTLQMAAHTLHTVDFSFNNLGNDSVRQLARLLLPLHDDKSDGGVAGFPALRRLELRGNPFTFQVGKCLVHACEGLRPTPRSTTTEGDALPRNEHPHERDAPAFQLSRLPSVPGAAAAPAGADHSYFEEVRAMQVDFIGVSDTLMSKPLQQALQRRIEEAVRLRETRRREGLPRHSRSHKHDMLDNSSQAAPKEQLPSMVRADTRATAPEATQDGSSFVAATFILAHTPADVFAELGPDEGDAPGGFAAPSAAAPPSLPSASLEVTPQVLSDTIRGVFTVEEAHAQRDKTPPVTPLDPLITGTTHVTLPAVVPVLSQGPPPPTQEAKAAYPMAGASFAPVPSSLGNADAAAPSWVASDADTQYTELPDTLVDGPASSDRNATLSRYGSESDAVGPSAPQPGTVTGAPVDGDTETSAMAAAVDATTRSRDGMLPPPSLAATAAAPATLSVPLPQSAVLRPEPEAYVTADVGPTASHILDALKLEVKSDDTDNGADATDAPPSWLTEL